MLVQNSQLILLLLIPQFLLGAISLKVVAQQPLNLRKEQLEFCVQQLTVTIGQVEAIKGVMQQENLTPLNKLEALGQILSPQQKEQLEMCMLQPMPK